MRITAAQAADQLEHYCEQAKIEPVVIEEHDRPSLVLIDFDAFQALRRAPGRPPLPEPAS